MKYSILICSILLVFTNIFSAEYTIPRKANSVCAEDLDLDGDKDIVVGHNTMWGDNNPTISILKNEGDGTFTIFDSSFVFCGYQQNIFAQKINNDNFPDIVTFRSDHSSGTADRYIRIFYNEYGFFNEFTDFSLNSSETFTDITYGDIDNDNDIDIIVTSNNGQFWGALYNDGTGQFSAPQYHAVTGYYPVDIACGNLNNDRRNDVVVCAQKTEVYFSYVSGFQCLTLEENNFKDEINIADMDHDGDNDIVVLVNLYLIGYTGITIYENIGSNNFSRHDEILFQPPLSHFEISDVNNDTLPDVVCTGDEGIYILYNGEGYNFSDPQFYPVNNTGEFGGVSYCADLDNSGWNDIITIIYLYSNIPSILNIFFNDGCGNFVEEPQVGISEKEQFISSCKIALCQNYPNPFNSITTISFSIPKNSNNIKISIYDIKGELVKTLINNNLVNYGNYTVQWDGTDNEGKEVSSGVYLYTLRVGENIVSKKMLLVK